MSSLTKPSHTSSAALARYPVWERGADRRQTTRHNINAAVTLLRRPDSTDTAGQPMCTVHLSDMSDEGVGAHCDTALPVEEPVTLVFPPHGPERGIDLRGHVVRCIPDGRGGYELGIAFVAQAA